MRPGGAFAVVIQFDFGNMMVFKGFLSVIEAFELPGGGGRRQRTREA
jgi:hypothetical protein